MTTMRKNFKAKHSARRQAGGVRPGRNENRSEPRQYGNNREKIYIYGKHALAEALANMPGVVRKVFLSTEAKMGMREDPEGRVLLKNAEQANIPVETLRAPREADRMVGGDTAHQGVVAIIDPAKMMQEFRDFVAQFESAEWFRSPRAPQTMLVLLDELTDPHNVGAIIRSAAAFGAAGVLIPAHNQAPITGAVVKASAGMAFRIPLVSIGNVNQAVDALAKLGFRSYGLAMDGARDLSGGADGKSAFDDAPALIIVGNEGKGIRQKTLERCDVTLRIPMDARAESLNASVSAAVVMYQWYCKTNL
jgi:23S rRNA (guanosine2251-2'-O)-methyltransferase